MSRAARIAAALILLGLAACEVPHPFERGRPGEGELGAPDAPILCVAPVPGLPSELERALRDALAEELVRREYLALAADPCPPDAPRILAWESSANGVSRLMFSRPAGGRPFAPVAIDLAPPADPALWPEAASRWAAMLADRLEFFSPAVRSVRAPFETLLDRRPPPAAPSPPRAATADDPDRIFVETVEGASGDGNTLLRFAMLGHLRRFGLKPEAEATRADAPYQVKGRVDIGPPRGEDGAPPLRRVRIVWTVSDAKGRTLGALEQANEVPAAGLDRAWGQAADAVVAAAAGGIAQILRQARASAPDAAAPPR